MKRLFFAILISLNLCGFVFAQDQLCMIQGDPAADGGVTAPAGCSIDNDEQLVASSFVATDATGTDKWQCSQMTVSATDDITSVIVGVCDAGTDSGNLVVGIYRHDATYNEPDADHGSGPYVSKTVAMSTITNCGDASTSHTITFDSVLENIGATTVWVCVVESSSYHQVAVDNTSGRWCASDAAAPVNNTNWTCYNSYIGKVEIWGCP